MARGIEVFAQALCRRKPLERTAAPRFGFRLSFGDSYAPAVRGGCRSGFRSGKVRITMTTVRDHGHYSRGFASLRLCVSALFRRATEVPYRFDTGFVSAPSRFRALGRFRSPNQAAPAKPAGASLFDSQPFERGLAEPRRSAMEWVCLDDKPRMDRHE